MTDEAGVRAALRRLDPLLLHELETDARAYVVAAGRAYERHQTMTATVRQALGAGFTEAQVQAALTLAGVNDVATVLAVARQEQG